MTQFTFLPLEVGSDFFFFIFFFDNMYMNSSNLCIDLLEFQ